MLSILLCIDQLRLYRRPEGEIVIIQIKFNYHHRLRRHHHLEVDDLVQDHFHLEIIIEVDLIIVGDYLRQDPIHLSQDTNHLDMNRLEITLEMTREIEVVEEALVHLL